MRVPFFIYHYGYARMNMNEVMQRKKEYYEKELAAHGAANKKFDQKVSDWFGKTEPLLFFDGSHPDIIRSHPMADVPSMKLTEEKSWFEDTFYKQVLEQKDYGNIWLCMSRQSQPHMYHYHNGVEL
jgi:hypothetical protein